MSDLLPADYIFKANSSAIDRVGFNATEGIVTVTFPSGGMANYFLDEDHFTQFISATSLGRFYSYNIRGYASGTTKTIDLDTSRGFQIERTGPSGDLLKRLPTPVEKEPVPTGDVYEIVITRTVEQKSTISSENLVKALTELQNTDGVTIVSVSKV